MSVKRTLFCVFLGACCSQAQPQPAPRAAKPAPSGASAQPATPKRPGSIDGAAVSSATGIPVKKATVSLRNTSQNFSYVAVSDSGGRLQFPSVEPGNYVIGNVSAPGYSYQVSGGRGGVARITVAEDQHVSDLKVLLLPLGAISGKIADDDGDPLAGATVQALHYTYANGARRLTRAGNASSDDRGEYRMFDIQPGRYFLRVTQRSPRVITANVRTDIPELGYETAYYPGVSDLSQALRVESTPGGELIAMDFRLRRVPTFHIKGQITNAPRPGNMPVRVQPCQNLVDFDPTATNVLPTQQDGKFDAFGVQPGVYCVSAQPNSPQGRGAGYAVAMVTITNRTVDDLQLTLMPVGDIQGTAQVDAQKQSTATNQVMSVQLQGTTTNDHDANARVGADGKFTIPGVLPDTYQITVNGLPPGTYLKSLEYNRQDFSYGILDVTASGGALALHLGSDTGRLNVTVQNEKGEPGAGMAVIIAPDGRYANRRDLLRVATTDANGRLLMQNVAPGEYRIYALEDNDFNLTQSADFQKEVANKSSALTVHSNGSESMDLKAIPAEEVQRIKNKLL